VKWETAIVVGKGPEATALREVILLFMPKAQLLAPEALPERAAATSSLPDPEQGVAVLVAGPGPESRAATLRKLIEFIRLEAAWVGPLIVVAEPADISRLARWDLFRLQAGEELVAQVCLAKPLRLVELLSALADRLDGYSEEQLKVTIEYLAKCGTVREVKELWRELEAAPAGEALPLDKCRKVLALLLDSESGLRELVKTGHHTLDELKGAKDTVADAEKAGHFHLPGTEREDFLGAIRGAMKFLLDPSES
jgi:hypothetical protein